MSFALNSLFKNEKIYIYPNLKGVYLGLFVSFCFLAAVFYQTNFALVLSIVIFFVFFISILISHQNIRNIENVEIEEYIEEGKSSYVSINLKNIKNEKKINLDIELDGQEIGNFNFLKTLNEIKVKKVFNDRGIKQISNLVIKSDFPFGVIKTKRSIEIKNKIFVYPKPIRPSENLFVNQNILDRLNKDNEFDNIDEFRPGDNLSKVAWKKTIAQNKFYVKKFKTYKKEEKIIIDLNQNYQYDFEKILNFSSYLVLNAKQNNVGLILKHKNKEFILTNTKTSLNEILKYLSYASQ